MKYDNKYIESIFKFKLMFHGIKCTEIEKKKQEPPLINSLLILLINLLYVDCCKLCSFKDLCKSDNDSHNQFWIHDNNK